jgi:hypothetical protein
MPTQPEFDVFLAHNSKDKPQIREVAKQLKQYGLNYQFQNPKPLLSSLG